MSTENIISRSGNAAHCYLTFACRDGSTRTYEYFGLDAALAMSGTDPAGLNGHQVEGQSIDPSVVKDFLNNAAADAEAAEASAESAATAAALL